MSMRSLCMLCLLLSMSCGFAARLIVSLKKDASPTEKRAVVVEFGGSGCKVVVYSGNEYLKPDPTIGEGDGVLRVPGFSKETPTVCDPNLDTKNCVIAKTAAENIQKVITDMKIQDGEPIVFFVSGGHISKYPSANSLCDPNLDSYVAKNCVPDSVTATRDLLQDKTNKIIAIETDEAEAEAMSVMAGFGHVKGAPPEYPVLILLGGSASSQLVYISSADATPVSSTFIMHSDNPDYADLVKEKLLDIMGGSAPKSVFFCSNFAFALVRPTLTSDAKFSKIYFADDLAAKAKVPKKYKPNQAAALTFEDVAYSLRPEFGAYTRTPEVWTTLRILLDVMAPFCTPRCLKDATFHVFKELTESGNIVKVGASHGVAMKLVR